MTKSLLEGLDFTGPDERGLNAMQALRAHDEHTDNLRHALEAALKTIEAMEYHRVATTQGSFGQIIDGEEKVMMNRLTLETALAVFRKEDLE